MNSVLGVWRRCDQGATPEREDAVRRRSGDGDSGESPIDETEEDADVAWHLKKKLQYVPVGETFELDRVSFKRTGRRQAVCARRGRFAAGTARRQRFDLWSDATRARGC